MSTAKRRQRSFTTAERSEIPTGRNGKHNSIVTKILEELQDLNGDRCLKIPISELPDSKANIRSALNRAAHNLNKPVATRADEEFLYIWNP